MESTHTLEIKDVCVHLSVFLLFLQREITFVTFCLPFWTVYSFQNRVVSEWKEFSPRGANSFLSELTPTQKGGKNESERVASPENVPIHLKHHHVTFYVQIHVYVYWKCQNFHGVLVAQWVKRWPTDLAAPSSSPA